MAPGRVLAFGWASAGQLKSPLSSQEVCVSARLEGGHQGFPPIVSRFHFPGFNTKTVPSHTGNVAGSQRQPPANPFRISAPENLEGVPPPPSACIRKQARQLRGIWCQLSQPRVPGLSCVSSGGQAER